MHDEDIHKQAYKNRAHSSPSNNQSTMGMHAPCGLSCMWESRNPTFQSTSEKLGCCRIPFLSDSSAAGAAATDGRKGALPREWTQRSPW